MAGEMIFPIKFDLDSAVSEASSEWDKKYADRLEKALAKRKIKVSLALETKSLDNLDDIQKRLKSLKIEPITPENRRAIQDLTRELKQLAKVMEKLSGFKNLTTPGIAAAREAKIRKETSQLDEKLALQKERVRQAEERLILSQQRAARQAITTGRAYGQQSTYLERLAKRLIAIWSIQQVGTFLTRIREVTAEFELQRVSLGAIIQDQTRANQLFSEIKQFALQSPISILDLTKYTKQVAAYRIETDKLFDTTKRLADVSVGLGVDMGRLVLAYGQVRAASYLRSAEIRQFTEAGIPILELLADKFTQLEGKAVSTAQVMDKVSKRMVEFGMVEEIFKDMTSAGGMFYNMQEKQAQTLFGMWAKLGDAASVMYDEIGNTDAVNRGMKNTINLLETLMRNWEATALTIGTMGGLGATFAAINKANKRGNDIQNAALQKERQAKAALLVADKRLQVAEDELTSARYGLTRTTVAEAQAARDAAAATQSKANADYKAAAAANANAQKQSKLALGFASIGKSLASGLGIGLVITLATTLIYKLYDAWVESNKLKDSLKNISADVTILGDQAERNFVRLANAAVKATDGSIEQKNALDELARTYGDIIPVEQLRIENLEKLAGNYSALTNAIRENIAMQQKQKALNEIAETYGEKIRDSQKPLREYLKEKGYTNDEIARFFAEFEKQAQDSSKSLVQVFVEAFQNAGLEVLEEVDIFGRKHKKTIYDLFESIARERKSFSWWIKGYDPETGYLGDLRSAYAEQENLIQEQIDNYEALIGEMGKYKEAYDSITTSIKEQMGASYDSTSFADKQTKKYLTLKNTINALKKEIPELGDSWYKLGESLNDTSINFKALLQVIDTNEIRNKLGSTYGAFQNFVAALQKQYDNIVPSNTTNYAFQRYFQQLAEAMEIEMDDVQQYMINATDSLEAHRKAIKETIEQVAKDILALNDTLALVGVVTTEAYNEAASEKAVLEKRKEFLEKYLESMTEYNKSTRGNKADPRIGVLKEMVQLAETLNKEYREMAAFEGDQSALKHVAQTYEATIKEAEATIKKHGLTLPALTVPKNASELREYLKAVQKELARLPKSDKDVIALGVKIDKNMLDEVQREMEKQLKALSDKIARSKTAKEFFDKIFDQTGNVDVAINMTMSVYGTSGGELQSDMANYLRELFGEVSIDTAVEVGTDNVNYNELEKVLKENLAIIGENNAKVIEKLIEDGKKANAAQVQQWFKDLKAAEDFADKRVKLARETAARIAEVEAQARLQRMGEAEKKALIDGYKQREDKEAAKLEYEAFKEMPMYVQLFSDLDNASTAMLTNMRDNLQRLQGQWKSLNPTQLKELQSRLNDIEKILVSRNPFKSLGEVMAEQKAFKQIYGDVSKLETKLDDATQEWLAYSDALTEATAAEAAAKASLENAKVTGGDVKAAKKVYDATKQTTAEAAENLKIKKQELEFLQKLLDLWKKLNDEEEEAGDGINKYIDAVRQALRETRSMVEAWSGLGNDELWNTIMDGLDGMLSAAEAAVTAFTSADPFTKATAAISAITGVIGTIGNLFYGARVARANKEIKRQQELIDQLEYAYNRLENAIDDAFGAAYLRAYRQQLSNLQKQQTAYLKQAEAERSKGKKADKDKIKDYENSARDAADAIADMQGTLAEKFLGSDLASAARDFAQAWLEAYKEFGNTADAMSEKFQDMIQNMVVESLLGSVMEKALKPAFDMIDTMNETDFMSRDFWKSLTETAAKAAQNADAGASTMMAYLEQAGVTMRDLGSDLTGISRDIATASEESINGLAAGINTQNFYISQQLAEVRLIREAVVNRGDSGVMFTDLMAIQNEHLSQLPVIAANTAATVERCERAALACEDMASQLRRVIRPKQETNANYVLNAKALM